MKSFWQNKKIYNVNSLARYSVGFPLTADNIYRTMKLSGDWKFLFCKSVDELPENFGSADFDDSAFGTIKVPSEWQIQGIDTPIYTNIVYPYAVEMKNLLAVPKIHGAKNSVGLYECDFELGDLKDEYHIHFGGVNSCAEIYLNGNFVGYSEDTFDFQEYDVTDYVKKGANRLSVAVYRYCTGSYLEDQDMWRLSGIFRDVYLVNKPAREIFDAYAKSDFVGDGCKTADLTIDADIKNVASGELVTEVYDDMNKVVFSAKTAVDGEKTTVKAHFESVNAWSHENPYVYRIELTLFDGGEFCDKRSFNFGFREIKITPMKDGRGPFILLNGKPLKFRGVNRHEFHPDYGHAVPPELIYKDLLICKDNNITAIRTSHYPNNRAFYDYCDKLGILVICENNLETHGLSRFIPGDSRLWTKQCVYRVTNMVNTYKNHPCIVCWSLGNEAGFGSAFVDMKKAVLDIDKTRFIHYEEDVTGKVSDVFSEMYAPLEKMDAIGQDKPVAHCSMTVFRPFGVRYGSEKYANLPYMQCEYAHCMGNSLGNFSDYWENFKKYDRMAGGFIWDFADQSIKVVNNGVTEYRFGGDFGDKPNAGVFAFNGILRADRTPNPALYEVRKQYQMVDFSLTDGNLTLLNNFMFTNLGGYALRLNYRRDGERVSESETVLTSVAPGETYSVKISEPDGYGEITLLAELVSPYERKVVAYEQFMLRKTKFALRELLAGVSCEEDNWQIKVNTSDTQIIVDKVTGGITSICKNGAEKLRNPIMPNFVRPTIDNDRFPQVNLGIVKKIMGVYKFHKAMKKLSPKSVKLTENGGIAKVHIDWKFLYARLSTEYTFGKDAVDFSMSVKPRCELIRYGFTFGTREAVKEMNFYAKGPFENYCDRKTAAVLGKYSGKAEDFSHEYLSPQENGNHTEARYLDLGSADNGFVITAKDMPFEFGVLPYSLDKLEAAAHLHELKKDDHYTVTVDGRQRGVGGDIPAVACLKPQYKIHRGESYGFTFRMTVK